MSSSQAEEQGESDLLHRHVQTILRGGLAASVALMASGVAIRLASGRDDAPAVKLFAIGDAGDVGLLVTALGILVLALTPAARVMALVAIWWREKDTRFVGIALFVLAALGVSVMLGKGG